MNADIELGRIAGIRIGVNWSWLIVFALIVWTLASGVFPSQNPGLSNGTYIAMAIIAALVFFASLLLHELGHAVQARREGVEIEGITLWLFGGVAQLKGMFPSAGAEFRIAIAGPLVSLGLGFLFVLVAGFAGLPGAPDGVFAWLGYINLFLLGVNLLPALPLDGGRVLRSGALVLQGRLPVGDADRRGHRARLRLPAHRSRSLPVHLSELVQRRLARVHRLVLAPGRSRGGPLRCDGAGTARPPGP